MAGWSVLTGLCVALPMPGIDTDQIIPARFMSTPRADGYGRFLLHDQREAAGGGHPLDLHPGAVALIAGPNFGVGSSREAAVYALVDFGVRAVIAPSFGDIFAANAANNGLAPLKMAGGDAARLSAALAQGAGPIRIDLGAGIAEAGGMSAPFDLPAPWRAKLINGWDEIDLTLADAARIAAYGAARRAAMPWAWPAAPPDP
jgi:3-isopropylmalate/(R)-2-methylmalate dehydratase small subunit